MALIVADRVQETTTTTGTGTYTLAGAKSGFQSFGVVGDGNTTYYACTDGTDYEVGIGTYTLSGTTLARTTIIESSNSDAAVNWGAGSKDIFVTLPASKAVIEDASNNVAIGNNLTVGGTVDGVDIATNIPATLGTAGQVLTVNAGATAGEWADASGGGGGALELYAENPSTPTAPSATGTNAVAIGDGPLAALVGKLSYASGQFAASGDAQGGQFILRAATTDATATVLTTNNSTAGTTNQIVAASDTCITFDGTITAMQNGAQAYASWKIEGLLVNDAGTTTLVNSATTVISNADGWGMALSADTGNNALAITVTGEAAHNIRWVANIRTTEVTYA